MKQIFQEESWDFTTRTRLHALPQSHLDLQICVFLFQSKIQRRSDGAVGSQEIFAEATKRKLFNSELVNDSRLDDFMDWKLIFVPVTDFMMFHVIQ